MDVKWTTPASAVLLGEKQCKDLWLALHLYGNGSTVVIGSNSSRNRHSGVATPNVKNRTLTVSTVSSGLLFKHGLTHS